MFRRPAQQRMQRGPAFGGIDLRAGQQRIAVLGQAAFARQLHQQRARLAVDQVAREVGENMRRLDAEIVRALRIVSEGGAQIESVLAREARRKVRAQGLPGRRFVAARAGLPIHQAARSRASSFSVSAMKARMPSASFSVPIAS